MTIAATRWEAGKASRRQSIIDATKDLLREGQVVSSSNIAKRAGVSVATVYNLVGKEKLIALILNELLTELSRIDPCGILTRSSEQRQWLPCLSTCLLKTRWFTARWFMS